VSFINLTDMQADFASRGVTVPLFDVEEAASLQAGKGSNEIFALFQLAKATYGDTAPEHYHGDLMPPACFALMRGSFAQVLGSPGM
jgi:hypothetical protein